MAISISLSPNTQKDDIFLSWRLLFCLWQWKSGKAIAEFKKIFGNYFNCENVFLTNSGRSALFLILKSLSLPKNSEVLLQAYTCNAAVNPVLWAGLKPVYVDIKEDSFNMAPDDLSAKITPNSKILIIQHTFGKAADLDRLMEIAEANNLIVIEDCAHSLAGKYQGKKLGTFGDFAYFSFGRDKVISSVYGGAVLINNDVCLEKMNEEYKKLKPPSYFWIMQQILHPILINLLVKPLYDFFGIGKIILVILQKIKILSLAVLAAEKRGGKPAYFPALLPNALAMMVKNQFLKLERFNLHRRGLANFYDKKLKGAAGLKIPSVIDDNIFLRYSIQSPRADELIRIAKQNKILLGDWYGRVIAPENTDLEKMGYKIGDCPIAEKVAKMSLNLPTHINITMKDAEDIVEIIKKCVG